MLRNTVVKVGMKGGLMRQESGGMRSGGGVGLWYKWEDYCDPSVNNERNAL